MNKPSRTYGIYVIELDGDPSHVYVGQSAHSPEHRLAQHLTGSTENFAAKVFRKGATGKLRPDLFPDSPRFDNRTDAI